MRHYRDAERAIEEAERGELALTRGRLGETLDGFEVPGAPGGEGPGQRRQASATDQQHWLRQTQALISSKQYKDVREGES